MTMQATETVTTSRRLENLPGVKFFKNLSIGVRLLIGFGILVVLTLLIVVFNYLGSVPATETITRTSDVRFPSTLAAARAQTNLFRMQSEAWSYLVLGDEKYRASYEEAEQAFAINLAELENISNLLSSANQQRLKQLQAAFVEWRALPETLFELRNDQLEREPAYRLLATDGSSLAGNILIDMNSMIETQAQREASAANMALLGDMAQFQGTFASMFSALRGYATTRNRIYRMEYEGNLAANEFAWDRLFNNRDSLSLSQQTLLDGIQKNREEFLNLPDEIFDLLESERWREDLYLFSAQAVPLVEQMQNMLSDMTQAEIELLEMDLTAGKSSLTTANVQALVIGVVALILGVGLAFIFRGNIAGPVRRLTDVSNRIRTGDLEAQAEVESRDEIGVLAHTFNDMTGRLRQTLLEVRMEKQRADDLLEVVIPIGVQLASEKDYNRLLETMLLEAKSFCHAQAGVLYLRTPDNRLEFVIVRNDPLNMAMGGATGKEVTFTQLLTPLPLYDEAGQPNQNTIATHVALSGQTLNIPDAGHIEGFEFSSTEVFGRAGNYRSISHLALPLKNSEDQVIGVLQLINAQDRETGQIIPFDQNIQQMMESFSSLAVAALEAYSREQRLRQEIRQLRIEIDEARRQRDVDKIVESDSFQTLKDRARALRRRRSKRDQSDTLPTQE
ncbi:MAG: HAMP domain-containing protein [Anaerolineae bacterium]|nr:HAMP domain-containing protein [Anaerolineae bacterium]